MEKPKHHVFVCGSFRVTGDPKGICHRKDSSGLVQYLETEVSDRGLDGVTVSSAEVLDGPAEPPTTSTRPSASTAADAPQSDLGMLGMGAHVPLP